MVEYKADVHCFFHRNKDGCYWQVARLRPPGLFLGANFDATFQISQLSVIHTRNDFGNQSHSTPLLYLSMARLNWIYQCRHSALTFGERRGSIFPSVGQRRPLSK